MKLCVNIDHVATLREARKTIEPDPIDAALIAVKAGAYGITIHLREDRRHIQDQDLKRMREKIRAKLNMEMAATHEMIGIALDLRPDQVTFVPEKRQEITTEGGLNVAEQESKIKSAIALFGENGVPVSLFIDPVPRQIEASVRVGAESVEINTGAYSECHTSKEEEIELNKIERGALYARDKGLKVYAGHGLNYRNIIAIARISAIEELNIGHSIVAKAVFSGLENAVKEMLTLLGSKKLYKN